MDGMNQEADGGLSHVDAAGTSRMVDVSEKAVTRRTAVAEGRVVVSDLLAAAISSNTLKKGDLLATARLAGVVAAKRTDELIPLCHSLPLEHVDVEAELRGGHVMLRATATTTAKTGVEMEAYTAVMVAALTVIDMGKAVDPAMRVEGVRLVSKTGGSKGDYHAGDADV
ncbi:MAG: cyclic pyranopterin monophosphate synthase MoaC [Planctomycetota bacterium]